MTAPAQVIEVSVQGSVEALPAIGVGQALIMDNVIPAPLCATYITCAYAPPLASTSDRLLLISTSAAAPLLVAGPCFPPRTQGPIGMLPGAPIVFPGTPVAPPAPYSAYGALGHQQHHNAPCRGPELCRAPNYKACHGLVSLRLMLAHLWPTQLGQWICLVTCLGLLHSQPLCKLSLMSLPGSAKT